MGRGALSIFRGHCQVHEPSLADACSVRKAERLGRANTLGLVHDQNLIAQFIVATRGRKVDCLACCIDQTCCSINSILRGCAGR